jgi:hemolysin III
MSGLSRRSLSFTVRIKEPFSALSHALGIILGFWFVYLLVTPAVAQGKMLHAFAFAVFGLATVLVYTASTLYHWLPVKQSHVELLRDIDQSAIYLMIAGTYTPVCLIVLGGVWGFSTLGVIWALATTGITLLWRGRRARHASGRSLRRATTIVYLAMGWISVIAFYPMTQSFSGQGLSWLIAGGIAYSVGALVYGLRWPNPIPKVMEFHEVFHIFVLIGTICHFWMMKQYVLPVAF